MLLAQEHFFPRPQSTLQKWWHRVTLGNGKLSNARASRFGSLQTSQGCWVGREGSKLCCSQQLPRNALLGVTATRLGNLAKTRMLPHAIVQSTSKG